MASDALVNGMAGAGGGIIALLLTYPLLSANTRQHVRRLEPGKHEKQQQQQQTHKRGVAEQRRGQAPGGGGVVLELLELFRREGLGSVYRGLQPSLIGTACSQGVYYYFYQLFRDQATALAKKRRKDGSIEGGEVGMVGYLLVAALAGSVNVLLTNPIWIIVTRMQLETRHTTETSRRLESSSSSSSASPVPSSQSERETAPSSTLTTFTAGSRSGEGTRKMSVGMIGMAAELYEEAGLLGFWKGVVPTLVMVSNPAIQFMIYELLMKRLLSRKRRKKQTASATASEIFILGAIAKAGATVTTYPLLVIKSRLQARQSATNNPSRQYAGALDVLVKVLRQEGVRGLYKGMSTKIVQSVFAASVLFLAKEKLSLFLKLLLLAPTHQQINEHKR